MSSTVTWHIITCYDNTMFGEVFSLAVVSGNGLKPGPSAITYVNLFINVPSCCWFTLFDNLPDCLPNEDCCAYLCVWLPVFFPACLSVYVLDCLPVWPPANTCMSAIPCVPIPVCSLPSLFAWLSTLLSEYLHEYLPVCLSVCLPTCLSDLTARGEPRQSTKSERFNLFLKVPCLSDESLDTRLFCTNTAQQVGLGGDSAPTATRQTPITGYDHPASPSLSLPQCGPISRDEL